MSNLPDKIAELEIELAKAKAQHAKDVLQSRPTAVQALAEIKVKLDGLIEEAQAIARGADIVFYYSNGYEEFSWQNKENWSYSSQDC